MTDIKWGPAIAVDGKRPGMIVDGEPIKLFVSYALGGDRETVAKQQISWPHIEAIALPADHPHYRQTEAAPIDWSGELEAVHEDGRVVRVRLHSDDGGKILPMRIDRELSDGVDDCIEYFDRDGSCNVGGWRIRNVPQPTPQADTKPDMTARVTKPVQSKRPDDLVVLGNRTWRITGVYIGALGQESAIGLVAMDRRPPHVGEDEVDEMIVPEALVEGRVFCRALALAGEKEA